MRLAGKRHPPAYESKEKLMTNLLLERFEPSESYNRTVNYAMTEASDRYRRDTARGLLVKAKSMLGEPVKRYRFVLDAIHVLDKFSPLEQPPIDPRNLTVLRNAAKHFLEIPAEQELAAEVQETIQAIEQTTWATFDVLVKSAYFQQSFDLSCVEGINAFEDWFKAVLPYFSLDLPTDDPNKAEYELASRIDIFINKLNGSSKGDPFEWRQRCIDLIWDDARIKWNQQR